MKPPSHFRESSDISASDLPAGPSLGIQEKQSFFNSDIFRFAIFLAMEVAFTALTWYCIKSPRQLPFLTLRESYIRSGFATIFNFWHGVALAFAAGICANSFSREWAARETRTDMVSTVTGTLYNKSFYFFKPRATNTYRIALVASYLIILMGTTASSTITISSGVQSSHTLPIASLPQIDVRLNGDLDSPIVLGLRERLKRATMIVQLEKIDGRPFSFIPPPNRLVPLPIDVITLSNHVSYVSDVVQFRHSCSWRSPDRFDGTYFQLDGEDWEVHRDTGGSLLNNADTFDSSTKKPGSTIIQLLPRDPQTNPGFAVYLFLGGNTTNPVFVEEENTNKTFIDLSDLPSFRDPLGFVSFDTRPMESSETWVAAPLATFLICSPNLQFETDTVVLAPNTNLTDPDITLLAAQESDSPHNIHPEAARLIISRALVEAIKTPDDVIDASHDIPHVNFNSVSSSIFMPTPSSGSWNQSSAIRPLSIETINQNVDSYILTALKAFTDGIQPRSRIINVLGEGEFTASVPATERIFGLILTTTLEWAVFQLVVVIVESALLVVLVVLNRTQNRQPFELNYIVNNS